MRLNESEFQFTFAKSSGAGGQNVNKVNTAATLTWNMRNSSSVSEAVKRRFREKFKRFVNAQGLVVVNSQEHRSQKRNIEECKSKLRAMLESVKYPPKKRRPTRPPKSAKRKRLESKKKVSEKKKLRKDPLK